MRRLRQLSASVTIITLVATLVFVLALFVSLRRDQGVRARQETAADRVFRSALLPDEGWLTYGADVWSIGYPEEFAVLQEQAGIAIIEDEEIYLTVAEETRAVDDIVALYEADVSMTKSEFLFAGYPATKFTHRNGREEYFVAYNDRLFAISSDFPTEGEVGIMLATFQFLY